MRGTSRCCRWVARGARRSGEFAVTEFAAALGRTTDSGRRYLSQAVEGFYRLRRCWARLVAGEAAGVKLCHGRRPHPVLVSGDFGVRWQSASFAHKVGPAQLARLIEEAKARFDPEALEAERQAAAEAGHFDIALAECRR